MTASPIPLLDAVNASFEDQANASGLGIPFVSRGVANGRIGFVAGGGVLGALSGGTAASLLTQRQLNATALQATVTKAAGMQKFFELEQNEHQIYSSTGIVLPLTDLDWHGMNGNAGTLLHQFNPNAPILTIGDATGASASGSQKVSGFALDYGSATSAVFTASVAANSNQLAVTGVAAGALAVGMTISSLTGSPTITAGPAAGGAGTYTLSATIATAVASTTMNGICLSANALVLGAAEQNYIEHFTVCIYYGTNPPNVAVNITATNTSAYWFQNQLVDLEVGGWMQNAFNLGLQGTGSEVVNPYFHNGSGEGTEQVSSGAAINLQPPGQVSDFLFRRFHVEHVKCQNLMVLQGVVNVKFDVSHFEDIVFSSDNGNLINHVGGKLTMDETYCLDVGNVSGQTNGAAFYESNYSQTVARFNGLEFKWSGYSSAFVVASSNGPGLVVYRDSTSADNTPQVTFSDIRFEDDVGNNLPHVILDSVSHPEALANGEQIKEYTPDRLLASRKGYLATVTAAKTFYAGDDELRGVIPATVSAAFTVTLNAKLRSSGTATGKPGQLMRFRRQSGTYSGVVTFADATNGTLTTSAAAGGDFLFQLNNAATAYALVT